jgi:glycine dehydrogenase subunit 1
MTAHRAAEPSDGHRITTGTSPLARSSIRSTARSDLHQNLGIEAVEIGFGPDGRIDPAELGRALDDKTAAVVYQSPNFFGVVEDVKALSDAAHGAKALSVAVVAEALSLALLESPGQLGADIVTGEAQSFGIPVSFGGPYLGFMACKKNSCGRCPDGSPADGR